MSLIGRSARRTLTETRLYSLVYVVVPIHNRLTFTRACLRSLTAQSYPWIRIIVVDDGSTDGSARAIASEFPHVSVASGDGDLWWTGATNVGVRVALDSGAQGDYVLLLNNDTTVGPDYIASLVSVARRNPRTIVGSVAIDARDGETIVDGGPQLDWSTAKDGSLNVGRRLCACLADGVMQTTPSALSGRGTLIPLACFFDVGMFCARCLPHYGADYEFTIRARRAGWHLVMSYEAPVLSHVEAGGITAHRGAISWTDFCAMFFSRRSTSCLLYRWRFALLAAPARYRLSFMVCDTVRTVGGALRDQLFRCSYAR